MNAIIEVFNHTLMITGFVFVMMLVIEYMNVLTNGAWRQRLATARAGQYLFAALMGFVVLVYFVSLVRMGLNTP